MAKALYAHLRDAALGCGLIAGLWPIYSYLRAGWTRSDREFYCLVMCAGHTVSYCLFNGTLLICEKLGWLKDHKMPRKKAEEPTKELYKQLVTEAAISHLVTSPIVALLFYDVARYAGMPLTSEPISQSWGAVALTIMAAHSFNDWAFYWLHRIFHTKQLYARFHKQHHAFRGSVGAAAEFAGPVEQAVANQFPTVGFCLLTGQHPLVQCIWMVLRLTQTYEVHSGYHFGDTWAGKLGLTANHASFHDHHHTENLGNFGAEHLDWLFGTMDHYVSIGEEEGYLKRRQEFGKERKEREASVEKEE